MDNLEALKVAAEQNDGKAQFDLGLKYLLGDQVEQDHSQAAKWLQMSAENGYPQAQIELGKLYISGRGVDCDLVEAYRWLEIAYIYRLYKLTHDQRDPFYRQHNMGTDEQAIQNLSELKRWLSSSMTMQQIAVAQERAVSFLMKMKQMTW